MLGNSLIIATIITLLTWMVLPSWSPTPWWIPFAAGFIAFSFNEAKTLKQFLSLAPIYLLIGLIAVGHTFYNIGAGALHLIDDSTPPFGRSCLQDPKQATHERTLALRKVLMLQRSISGITLYQWVNSRHIARAQADTAVREVLVAFEQGKTAEEIKNLPAVTVLPNDAKRWVTAVVREHVTAAQTATPSTWEQHAPTWAGGLPPCD